MPSEKWKQVRIMANGAVLKTARIENGYSVRNFAALIGISKQQVYAIEKGSSGVSERTAERMAQRLHKSFAELFEFVWPDTESMEQTLREGERVSRELESMESYVVKHSGAVPLKARQPNVEHCM